MVRLENANGLEMSVRCRLRALVCSGSGIDEDKRSALDPCSSSDLERVAGTRLADGELTMRV